MLVFVLVLPLSCRLVLSDLVDFDTTILHKGDKDRDFVINTKERKYVMRTASAGEVLRWVGAIEGRDNNMFENDVLADMERHICGAEELTAENDEGLMQVHYLPLSVFTLSTLVCCFVVS